MVKNGDNKLEFYKNHGVTPLEVPDRDDLPAIDVVCSRQPEFCTTTTDITNSEEEHDPLKLAINEVYGLCTKKRRIKDYDKQPTLTSGQQLREFSYLH